MHYCMLMICEQLCTTLCKHLKWKFLEIVIFLQYAIIHNTIVVKNTTTN